MAENIEIIDKRRDKFVIVPRRVIDDLEAIFTPSMLTTYMALCVYAGNSDGQAYPKIATLARIARCNDRTVRRNLKALEQAGYINVNKRYNDSGRQVSNQYILI